MSRLFRHLTPSLVISLLALVIATSSGAYAAVVLHKGEVKTRHLAKAAVTTAKLSNGAVNAKKVKDFSLNLHDLSALDGLRTRTVASPITVPADECRVEFLALHNPMPPGLAGSLVVGHLTDAAGNAVMDNGGVVVPTLVSETSQGGALINLMVCASVQQVIPAGSIFHFQVIQPGT